MEKPILYLDKESCCGCTACAEICPVGAIAMEIDEEGFEYPQIDLKKCKRCYLCIKVCPVKKQKHKEP